MNVLATQRGSAPLPVDARGRRGAAGRPRSDLITGALVREARAPRRAGTAARRAVPARQGEGGVVLGEGLRRRLRRGRLAVRREPRHSSTTSRSGPTTSTREHVDAINRRRAAADRRRRGRRAGRARRRDAGRAAAVRLRDRRDEGDAHRARRSPRPRTRSRTAASRPCRTGSATRRCSPQHVERVIRGTTFPAGKLVEPGRRAVGRQGRHDARAVRAAAGAVRGGRAPRRRVHARRHADARRSRDARGPQWRKVIFNAATNPLGALTRPHARPRSASSRRCAGSSSRLVDEGKAVAAAQGIELDADPEELIDHAARPEVAYGHKASMLQDVEARRQTESRLPERRHRATSARKLGVADARHTTRSGHS